MKEYFSDEQKIRGINKIYLEEDDVTMTGEFIEGEGTIYIITGEAVIDGEDYTEFKIEFELTEEPSEEKIEDIMSIEWECYDYLVQYK